MEKGANIEQKPGSTFKGDFYREIEHVEKTSTCSCKCIILLSYKIKKQLKDIRNMHLWSNASSLTLDVCYFSNQLRDAGLCI